MSLLCGSPAYTLRKSKLDRSASQPDKLNIRWWPLLEYTERRMKERREQERRELELKRHKLRRARERERKAERCSFSDVEDGCSVASTTPGSDCSAVPAIRKAWDGSGGDSEPVLRRSESKSRVHRASAPAAMVAMQKKQTVLRMKSNGRESIVLTTGGTRRRSVITLQDASKQGEDHAAAFSRVLAQRLDQSRREKAENAFDAYQKENVVVGIQIVRALQLLGHAFPPRERLESFKESICNGRAALDEADFLAVWEAYETEQLEVLRTMIVQSGTSGSAVVTLPVLLGKAGVPLMPGAAADSLNVLANLRLAGGSGTETEAQQEERLGLAEFARVFHTMNEQAGLTNQEYRCMVGCFETATKSEDMTISQSDCVKALSWNEQWVALAGGPTVVEKLVEAKLAAARSGRFVNDPVAAATAVAGAMGEWCGAGGGAVGRQQSRRLSAAGIDGTRAGSKSAAGKAALRCAFSELLASLRILHELAARGLRKVYETSGFDAGEALESAKVVEIFERVGYLNVTQEHVADLVQNCGFPSADVLLTFEQVFTVLLVHSRSDGLTSHDRELVIGVFKRFDANSDGFLDVNELGRTLRWLGYQPSLYRICHFAMSCELKMDGQLTLPAFRKAIGRYRNHCLELVYEKFAESCNGRSASKGGSGSTGRLEIAELPDLLHLAGHEVSKDEGNECKRTSMSQIGGVLTFQAFKSVEKGYRESNLQFSEQNGGFTKSELTRYTTYFKSNCGTNGCINQNSLRDLFLKLFPAKLRDKEFYDLLAAMVAEADADKNKQFDQDEFISLMQHLILEIDSDILSRGVVLVQSLSSFKRQAVQQYWSLFVNCQRGSRFEEIAFQELAALFSCLVRMDAKAEAELYEMFLEVDDGDKRMNFWEFLSFMKKVQAQDWRGLGSGDG